AGGNGTRLRPLTNITNKHLLPVYDRPMIYHPIKFLTELNMKEVVLVTGREFAGSFANLLGDGSDFRIEITYKVQNEAKGIAHAIGLAEKMANNSAIVAILGDNIFSLPNEEIKNIKETLHKFEKNPKGAIIFLKKVKDPQRFGVAEVKNGKVINVEEKPKKPKSNLAVTGLYVYDNTIFDKIKMLTPSWRNELEITDVNNMYIKEGRLKYHIIKGSWTDAGTFESLFAASIQARKQKSQK
ncbi:glucose-1-phosphate thymidylyltransferase, partial [mine drainage metagenome]